VFDVLYINTMFDSLRYAELDAEVCSWLEEQDADYQRWAMEAFIEQADDEENTYPLL
jgi:hypothetical protein